MRCLDTASNEETCRQTVKDTFCDFFLLGYRQKTFLQALRGLKQRYHILETAFDDVRVFGRNRGKNLPVYDT